MKYLSEKISELPVNCFYDKGKIGCGGTSLALECNEPYVVCVPFIALIENKMNQYPNKRRKEEILAVSKNTGKMDIKYYDRSVKCPKILVTYDSLWKVAECVDTKKYRLLIDEYHLLFNQYSFRKNAVDIVLEHYKKFKYYTFMTATPLEKDFILSELKDIPLIREEWNDVIDVNVKTIKCSNVVASTIKMINYFLSGDISGNAYLFVNSLDFIKEVYKRMNTLDDTNSKIIYSKYNKTIMPVERSSVSDPIKKINFLTSTVFEGADIYDPDGRILIISDPSKANTLLDISTSIQQIAGRIRNSKYINQMWHLYSTTRYSSLSYDEFKKLNEKNIEDSQYSVNEYNSLSETSRKKIVEFDENTYIQKLSNGFFSYDPNMAKVDLYNYKVTRGMYTCRVNLESEYQKYNIETDSFKDSSVLNKLNVEAESFKDIVLKIKNGEPMLQIYKDRYPFLERAINELGFERISTLNYVQKNIKNELLIKSDNTLDYKIAFKLYKKMTVGEFYTPGDIKKYLTQIYLELNVAESAKSNHVDRYFIYTTCTKRINGTPVKGIIPTEYKFIIR